MATLQTDDLHEEVGRRLRSADQRYTDGRRALVDVLAAAQRPLTLPEITASVPEMPQSSAYRNLDALQQGGVVHRIASGGDRAHFELAESLLGHHHHLICDVCGAIEDMSLDAALENAVEKALAGAAKKSGFTPFHHNVDLYGRCSVCTAGL